MTLGRVVFRWGSANAQALAMQRKPCSDPSKPRVKPGIKAYVDESTSNSWEAAGVGAWGDWMLFRSNMQLFCSKMIHF